MSRFRQDLQCSVPGCTHEWMAVKVGKFHFCEIHAVEAKAAYQNYKSLTAQALQTFSSVLLLQAAEAREWYDIQYVRRPNAGHEYFLKCLRELAALPLKERAATWKTWFPDT